MPVCARCKKEIGFIGSLLSFNQKTGRCGDCEKKTTHELNRFRRAFIKYCEDGILSPKEWDSLRNVSQKVGLAWDEALRFVQTDALQLLERTLVFITSDDIVTEEKEANFHDLAQKLQLPPKLIEPLVERLNYQKHISDTRQGKLTAITASVHLEADELCYMETPAMYQKITSTRTHLIPGRLIATDRKLHFLSATGGWAMLWKNVMQVQREAYHVYIELSTQKGNGCYQVSDPLLVEAMLNTITRITKRQLSVSQDDMESRHIPHEVKVAVWQRDQGKCVQCGATSYLEFDHIIPFSKGGANTVNNVQLLCRKCNLAKGGRI